MGFASCAGRALDSGAVELKPRPPDVRVTALVQRRHSVSIAQPFPFHWVWEVQRRETGPVQLSMAFKGIYQRGEDVSHLCRAEIPDGWLCALLMADQGQGARHPKSPHGALLFLVLFVTMSLQTTSSSPCSHERNTRRTQADVQKCISWRLPVLLCTTII